MREKKDHLIYIVMIIVCLIAISAIGLAGLVGKMYVHERDLVDEAQAKQIQLEAEAQILQENSSQYEKGYTQEEVDVLLEEKEIQTQKAMKNRILQLLEASGSSLYMLRSIFQEKLVFTDDGAFCFVDISDNIKKHQFLNENFIKNEKKEIEYIENGNVVSHKGIDVSKYQGKIDWKKVHEDGVEFAIIRIGVRGYESGKIVLDDYFDSNIKAANAEGIHTGVYFFTQAITVEEANEEAEFVIEHLSEYDITCPVVFDVEKIEGSKGRMNNLTQEERTDVTIAFCEKIKEAGYIPMIYGNIKCFGKQLDISRLEEYEKWFAFYDDYLYYPYSVDMWQYSEKGKVNGIKGDVDLNISFHLW